MDTSSAETLFCQSQTFTSTTGEQTSAVIYFSVCPDLNLLHICLSFSQISEKAMTLMWWWTETRWPWDDPAQRLDLDPHMWGSRSKPSGAEGQPSQVRFKPTDGTIWPEEPHERRSRSPLCCCVTWPGLHGHLTQRRRFVSYNINTYTSLVQNTSFIVQMLRTRSPSAWHTSGDLSEHPQTVPRSDHTLSLLERLIVLHSPAFACT